MAFQQVCMLSDLQEGQGSEFLVGSQILAIFRIRSNVFAVDGFCAHQGGPIAKGKLQGSCITCPWHGWQYDITSGIHLLSNKRMLACFATEVRADEVWVDIDSKSEVA